MLILFLAILTTLLIVGVLFWFVYADKIRLEAENNNKDKRIEQLERDLGNAKETYNKIFENVKQELEKNAKTQDENVFNRVKLMFNEDSKKILDDIFMPIKQSIDDYSKSLMKNESALKQNIKDVFDYSLTMRESAESLTKILKGDKKIRGNFGEMQLKSILESSGLIEGEHYKIQSSFKAENQTYIPDAVVYLDGGIESKRRSIIIDSKFSLPNSFIPNLCVDSSEYVEELHLAKDIVQNLKKRIDELSKKPYEQFSLYTYDFVLLFIPYNNILDLALQTDSDIYKYAYDKQIYLVTPHTLFMALKTINISWIHIQRDKNVQEAFREIGNFYDKFAGAIETFEAIKKNFTTLGNNIENLDKQLISGRGNLCGKFESLKNFGVTPKKQLPI